MSNPNQQSNPNIPADQAYGAHKVGEFTHNKKGYDVQTMDGTPARAAAEANMMRELSELAGGEEDFKKKHKLEKNDGGG